MNIALNASEAFSLVYQIVWVATLFGLSTAFLLAFLRK